MSTNITNLLGEGKAVREALSDANGCFKNSGSADWASYGILAILFLVITSDIFVDNVLCMFKSAVKGRNITFVGAIISVIILIMAHIVIMSQINN